MPEAGFADIPRSCAAALGIPGHADALGLGRARHVVMLLVDGLGSALLAAHPGAAPHLQAMGGRSVDAVFPTTTVSALGSLGTGLLPGQHGLVGGSFWLPDIDAVLAPLQWGEDPHPTAVQPEATIFEQVAAGGVAVTTIAPAAYRRSGLTRAALRGSRYVGAEGIDERVAALVEALSAPGLTYVYWPELDRIGHGSGVDSPEWRAALGRADTLVGGLRSVLGPDDALVVTADHGMVDVTERIAIEGDAELRAGVSVIAGEPRVRHAYAAAGEDPAAIARRWRDRLGERADVMTRSGLLERGLLGPVDPGIEERIGDVVAICRGTFALASAVDPTVSALTGQHGAVTAQERRVPALVARGS